MVLLLLSVIAQHSKALGNIRVIRNDHAAVAVRAQIFPGIETKCGSVSQGPRSLTFVQRAVSLAGVFNHDQLVTPGNPTNRIHGRGVSIEVNRKNRLGAWSDGTLDPCDVNRVSIGIRIHKNWRRPGMRNREHGSNERVDGRDDLCARSDGILANRQFERRVTGVDTHGILGSAESSELLLEKVYFTPQNEVGCLNYLFRCFPNFPRNLAILCRKVNEWNLWLC